LVVLQFALASSLLIATLTIVLQTRFMSNMNTGMNTENVIRVSVNKQMRKKMESIKTELTANSIIESVTHTQQPPYKVYCNGWGLEWEGKDPNYSPLITYPKVDPDFLKTFKIELKEGRFFNAENPAADSMCVVVNEKFAKIMSDESVVNNTLRNGTYDYRIIGVVQDYNVIPNHSKIPPVLIRMSNSPFYMYVRYVPGNSSKAVNVIKDICDNYNPDFPLSHSFMHNNYDRLFKYNRNTARLLLYAAILAIIVSCLGLFGLASFTAEERTKEIGVRKVLGASMQQLIMIFGKDFSKWILISSLVSWPLTFYIMERWFEDYPYRIDFPYWLFAAVLAILLLVAIITIGYQSWKSATRNPVVSLKYE
jgi:ABC-type antimicrobial peptide transport system permease subunit